MTKVDWNHTSFEFKNGTYEILNRTYPYFNEELPKMEMWYLANPKKRKKNHFRFIVNWLNRVQKEKVKVRNVKDDEKFKKGLKKMKQESAPPPKEWQELKKKLGRST